MKTGNQYLQYLSDYSETPKAVYAAIAFSLAMRLTEDDFEAAARLLRGEWDQLHENGIVPQGRRTSRRLLGNERTGQ